jgi:putative two-component system hydrogenase maturation factor HypX/HoxX
MRGATKSSLYRNEVTEAAAEAVKEAVARFERGSRQPPDQSTFANVKQQWRGPVKQQDRAIDWLRDGTEIVLRKIASGDGTPGVRDRIGICDLLLFNAQRADVDTRGAAPGEVIGRSDGAILRATRDGAVWIGHGRLARPNAIKLPAAHLLADTIAHLPEFQAPRDIWYEESEGVGYLHFPFLNGAMGVEACRRLRVAFEAAAVGSGRVLVLLGGPDFWSNGLDLNEIEAAASPADQSWANINAIDDLAERIVNTTDKIVVSAMCGNAGAGGVFLARCADEVWLRRGVILNPHYKDMGNLYGSELWTYLLPRHVGKARAQTISQARLPMGAEEALRLGLADRIIDAKRGEFVREVSMLARRLAASPDLSERVSSKRRQREADEAVKPLSVYRAEELQRMHRNFYGFDPSYHIARYNFVHKVAKSRTPLTIARHRDKVRRASTVSKEGVQ